MDRWQLATIVAAPFVGSFVGLLADRLPAGRPVLAARSACDACGRRLGALELVPIASRLALGGRCRACRAPIPRRTLVFELAGLAVGVAATLAAAGPLAVIGAALGWSLLLLAALDWEHFWLPRAGTWPLAALGLAFNATLGRADLIAAAIGLAAGYASLAGIAALYRRARSRDGLGGGDPPFFAAAGAWLGWSLLPAVLLLACVSAIAQVATRTAAGGRVEATDRVPLGTHLAAAIFAAWLLTR